MPRKKFVAIDQIPDPSPGPLDALTDAEDEREGAVMIRKASAFRDECRELQPEEQALCAAFLMDDPVPGRRWGRMQSTEVARLFGRTSTWARVWKLIVRRRYSCGGDPSSCGDDQPACAHARGRKILYRTVIKALNRPAA